MGDAPSFESIEQAEAVAVRVALERGYLNSSQLREALLLREQLRMRGRRTRLLQLLGTRYIPPQYQAELSRVYFAALNALESEEPPLAPEPEPEPEPASNELETSQDELAIPELLLAQSNAALQRPPSEDPDRVQEFMRMSSELPAPPRQAAEDADVTESGLLRWIKNHIPKTR